MSLSKLVGAKLSTPIIGDEPHHPPISFQYPKREFGKKQVVKRSFQPAWFKHWGWLHYDEEQDLAFCHTCVKAYNEKKFTTSHNLDPSFLSRGFNNWKDTTVKFKAHELSKCHQESVEKIFTLPNTTQDIGETLSQRHKQEHVVNRRCFLKILSSMRFLTRQGLPLRGDGNEADSNFLQLLRLRGEDSPEMLDWIKKKTGKYTSAEIQNEILKLMALEVLRKIAKNLHNATFYTVMIDETTDCSTNEQVVVCFRWVDDDLNVYEEFVGLHQVDNISADTLVAVIKDTLLRLNLTLSKVRGQCYDGAANMTGSKSGVATQIRAEQPKAVFTHCYGHSLNLACADSIKRCKVIKEALETTYEITKLVKMSPRRSAIFKVDSTGKSF